VENFFCAVVENLKPKNGKSWIGQNAVVSPPNMDTQFKFLRWLSHR